MGLRTDSVVVAAVEPAEQILDGREEKTCDFDSGTHRDLSILLTVEEAANLLCLGRTTTYELAMRGLLRSVKVGRRRLVIRDGLRAFVAELEAAERQSQCSWGLQSTEPMASAAFARSGSRR